MLSPEITLYSALIGSASGVLISQLFDILKLRKRHRFNLQKEFFSRKLDAFEKTVVFWTNTQSAIHALEMIMNSLINPSHYFDDETSIDIVNNITKNFNDINDKSKELTSSLRLYTDILDNHPIEKDIIAYFNSYAELGYLFNILKTRQAQEIPKEQFKERFEKGINKTKDLSITINKSASNLINELRLELKKYDY